MSFFIRNLKLDVRMGLVGEWCFDENSGNSVIDSSGKGNHGSLVGAPIRINGIIGKALSFNGSSDYVNIGNVASLNFNSTQSFTVSLWFKNFSSIGDHPMVGKKLSVTTVWAGYLILPNGTNDLRVLLSDATNAASAISTGGYVSWQRWNLGTFVVNRANQTLALYVNGIADPVIPTDISAVGSLSNAVIFAIGTNSNKSIWFNGSMDDVRIYSRALSVEDITVLYNRGRGFFN